MQLLTLLSVSVCCSPVRCRPVLGGHIDVRKKKKQERETGEEIRRRSEVKVKRKFGSEGMKEGRKRYDDR